ncbi:CHH-like protein [Amphibalanus amphitrite]|uniref:CHH-like protein n=1 Tax=Amphibalanus amphitrite TaxID=1232801 RepID=UPI001C9147B7|nr:CHH-like protein [Amphibalanus amphitrite]
MSLTGLPQLPAGRAALLCCTLVYLLALCATGGHGLTVPDAGEWRQAQSKRSFAELRCRGVFDIVVFRELNGVCQECFTIYKEPELYGLCRSECFSTQYFQGCLQALLRTEEAEKFESYIRRTSGRK